MTRTLTVLWRGDMPLVHAFWSHAVLYAALASLTATVTAYGMIAAGLPSLLAAVVYLAPTPYIAMTVIGTWRSAGHYRGRPIWRDLARVVAPLWGGLMIVL